jgi:fructose-1,6-bisphosphatase/inositol monophosphatase family enzyme
MTSINTPRTAGLDRYLSPADVCALIPGMTEARLKMARFNGTGPEYLRPTPRTIVYSERRVLAWLEASARQRTSQAS